MKLPRLTLLSVVLALLPIQGCRARAPGKLETAVVNWTKHQVTVGGKKTPNPYLPSQKNIAAGKTAFTSYCMVCHGLDGQNTGVPFAATLSPPVPSLASPEIQAYTDGQLQWIIENGLYPSGMPPSAGTFSDDDMWKMVLYIRHLPPKSSLGEPKVYSGG